MDNKKIIGLLGLATKAGKVIFGTESCMDSLNKGKIKLLILATDSADRTKKNFGIACESKKIEMRIALTIEELSCCIGQNNKAVIGIKDSNFSKEILKIINGGDIIE